MSTSAHSPVSPFIKVGGLVYFARMLDKIRRQRPRRAPPRLPRRSGPRPRRRCCSHLHVSYEALRARVLAGGTDRKSSSGANRVAATHRPRFSHLERFRPNAVGATTPPRASNAPKPLPASPTAPTSPRSSIFEVDEGRPRVEAPIDRRRYAGNARLNAAGLLPRREFAAVSATAWRPAPVLSRCHSPSVWPAALDRRVALDRRFPRCRDDSLRHGSAVPTARHLREALRRVLCHLLRHRAHHHRRHHAVSLIRRCLHKFHLEDDSASAMPLSPTATRDLLASLGHHRSARSATKSLVDGNIVHKSLALAGVRTRRHR